MATIPALDAMTALVLVKKEVSYCTDPVPTETDAMILREFKLTPEMNFIPTPSVAATFKARGANLGSLLLKMEFQVDIGGPLDPDAGAPRIGKLFEACGMVETVLGAAPVTGYQYDYQTRAAQDSLTFYIVFMKAASGAHDIYKISGCRGKIEEISIGVDEAGVVKFSFWGLFAKPVAGALDFSTVDYGDGTEQKDKCNGKAMTCTWNSVDVHAKAYSLKPSRTLGQINTFLGTYGVGEILVTAAPDGPNEISVDPPETLMADYDYWAPILAETEAAMETVIDSVLGTRWTIDNPAVQHTEFGRENDDAIRRLSNKWLANDATDAGDDATTITIERTP
jgi:hypothetical protein